MIFSFFLGMCSYLAVSRLVKTSAGLGVAVVFVMLITVGLNYLIDQYLLSATGKLSLARRRFATVDLSFVVYYIHSGYSVVYATG